MEVGKSYNMGLTFYGQCHVDSPFTEWFVILLRKFGITAVWCQCDGGDC